MTQKEFEITLSLHFFHAKQTTSSRVQLSLEIRDSEARNRIPPKILLLLQDL